MTKPSFIPALLAATLATIGAVHASGTTTVPVGDWGDITQVAGGYPTNDLLYLFAVTPDQPLSLSATFVTSSYAPGRYDPGYISPGWFAVIRNCYPTCGYEGNVIFEIAKPYNTEFTLSNTQILIGDGGRIDGKLAGYSPGAAYTTTMTWNRAAGTIDISVGGASRTVSSYGDTIAGLLFHGPTDTHMTSGFGQLAVSTTPVPEPGNWLMLAAGLGALGFKSWRRSGVAAA